MFSNFCKLISVPYCKAGHTPKKKHIGNLVLKSTLKVQHITIERQLSVKSQYQVIKYRCFGLAVLSNNQTKVVGI